MARERGGEKEKKCNVRWKFTASRIKIIKFILNLTQLKSKSESTTLKRTKRFWHLAKNWKREIEKYLISNWEPHASRRVTRAKSINTQTIIGAREALLLRRVSYRNQYDPFSTARIEWSRSVNTIEFNPQLLRFRDRVHHTSISHLHMTE